MISSKLFLPEGRMWRVKRNEDKKAGKKKEGKGIRGNLERFQQKKNVFIKVYKSSASTFAM